MSALGAAFARRAFLSAAFNTEGDVPAPLFAQFGVMRFGAARFGYHSPKVFVTVAGVHRAHGKDTASEKLEDLSIQLANSDTPNRASFRAVGWQPVVGMEIIIQLGSKNRVRRLFGGTVLTVQSSAVGLLPVYQVECVDWNWLLDDEPIYGHFTGSASAIALELMADAPAGFTTRQVETGLPTVDGGITFTGVKRSAALRRLAKRAGARQFIDARKDLYFRVTPAAHWTNPAHIVGGLDTLKHFRFEHDLGQVANRVPFEGGGSNALAEVAIGETILPLDDAPDWWYGDVGGVVISGPQKITYTARVEGGGGSLVGPGAAPSSAPNVALAAGSGVTSGAHDVAVAFQTASGISLPSQRTSITAGTVSAPTSAAVAGAPSSGGSMNAGTHRYYPVFRTAAGSTTAGPVSNAVTAEAAIANPTQGPTVEGTTTSGSLDGGALYGYEYSYWDGGSRETATSPVGDHTTSAGAADEALLIRKDSLPTPPSGYQLRWYRTEGGGAVAKLLPYGKAAGQFDDSLLYLVDRTADADLGASPPGNTTGKGTCAVTGIPVPTEPLVTHVDMYREFNSAGASTAKLAFSVVAGVTSASDTVANASLGATVPSSNTAVASQIALSSVAVGPSGTTDRLVYMTEAGDPGGTLKLALTIANNTATTGTITTADGSLGAAAETVDGSGLAQPEGSVLPGETSIPIAGTAPFLAAGGWATYGSQVVRYTGFSGTALTGVPASGAGAITQPINYNTTIAAAPCLTGIPASGDGSIRYTIPKGESVNLLVTVEDTDAQAALQALLSAAAPVVRECPPLSDQRVSRAEALNRATAFLTLRAHPGVRIGPYRSKDINHRVGLEVDINVTTPLTLAGTFEIQSVTITNFTPNLMPDHLVTASDELFSIESVLSKEG